MPPHAWGLLLGNLFWVLAYDTEYAMVDRDDDLQVGMKTSAITLGRWDVAAVMAFYAIYLASWAALGLSLGLGRVYLLGIAVAAAQAAWHYTLIRQPHARRLLQGLPAQPLAGVCRVLRRGGRPGAALNLRRTELVAQLARPFARRMQGLARRRPSRRCLPAR